MTDTLTETQDLEFVRDYKVSVDRLWRAVTDPAEVIEWFGPEGVDIAECSMALSQRGPWSCTMIGRESGDRFKVTGVVTHVRSPSDSEGSVGFTWAWHDEADQRGKESHVIFEVSATEEGARLRLIHRELADMDIAQKHTQGWLSTLRKLDTHLSAQGD